MISSMTRKVAAFAFSALMVTSSVPVDALAQARETAEPVSAAAAATVQSVVGQLPQQDDAASTASQADKSQGAVEASEPAATTPDATAPAEDPAPQAHTLAWTLAEAGATTDATPLAQGTWDLELGESKLAEGVTLQCGRAVAEAGNFFVVTLKVSDTVRAGHGELALRLSWDGEQTYVAHESAFVTLGQHSASERGIAFDDDALTLAWSDPQSLDAQELYLELYLGDAVAEGKAADEERAAEREETQRQSAEQAEAEVTADAAAAQQPADAATPEQLADASEPEPAAPEVTTTAALAGPEASAPEADTLAQEEEDAAYQQALYDAAHPEPLTQDDDAPASYAKASTLSNSTSLVDGARSEAAAPQTSLSDELALSTPELAPVAPGNLEEETEPLSPIQTEMTWALYDFGTADDPSATPFACGRFVPRMGEQRLGAGVTLEVGILTPTIFDFDFDVADAAYPGHTGGYDLRIGYDSTSTSLDVATVLFNQGMSTKILVAQRARVGEVSVAWADRPALDTQCLRFSIDTGRVLERDINGELQLTPAGSSTNVMRALGESVPGHELLTPLDSTNTSLASDALSFLGACLVPQALSIPGVTVGNDYIIRNAFDTSVLFSINNAETGPNNWNVPYMRKQENTSIKKVRFSTVASSDNKYVGFYNTNLRALDSSVWCFINRLGGSIYCQNKSSSVSTRASTSGCDDLWITESATGGYKVRDYNKNYWHVSVFDPNTTISDNTTISNSSTTSIGSYRTVWTFTKYSTVTVTYYSNNGTGTLPSNQTLASGWDSNFKTGKNSLTRTGYTANGWNTKADGTGTNYSNETQYSVPSGNLNLYAKWKANTYTVTLDRQSGTGGSASVTATYGSVMPTATMPTRTGYDFGGYYTSTNGGGTQYYTAAGASARSWDKTAATTLYAKWTAKTYTGKINLNGGTGTVQGITNPTGDATLSQKLIYGSTNYFTLHDASAAPTKTGYTLAGWYTAATGGTRTHLADGTCDTTTGYWDASHNWIHDGDVTFYCHWTANTYSIVYDGNGATAGSTAPTSCTYDTSAAFAANGFEWPVHEFLGWSTDPNATEPSIQPGDPALNLIATNGGEYKVYAIWKLLQYDVTFDDQGGTGGTGSVTIIPEQPVADVAVPTRDNYTFGGYYEERGGSGALVVNTDGTWASVPEGACTIYAKWTYAVTYDKNDVAGTTRATGEAAATDLVYNAGDLLSDGGTLARTGYTLDGWAITADGDKAYDLEEAVDDIDDPKVLYAHWAPNTYKVAYEANAPEGASTTVTGMPTSAATWTFDASDALAAAPSLTGYTFGGWFTAPSGEATRYDAAASTTDNLVADPASDGTSATTLYARWTADTYTVTLDRQGSVADPVTAGTESVTATFDATMPAIAVPTRPGYTFLGYYDIEAGVLDEGATCYYDAAGAPQRTWAQAEDGTLYACWSYIVTFHGNEGEGSTEVSGVPNPTDHIYGADSYLCASYPTRVGYDFMGWNTRADGTGTGYGEDADVSDVGPGKDLYAVWRPQEIDAELDGQDADTPSPTYAVATFDSPLPDVAVPTKDDYAFKGYRTQPAGAGDAYVDAAGHGTLPWRFADFTTLYAQWDYDITYEGNKGSGSSAIQGTTAPTHHTYKATSAVATNGFSRTGYTFRDWNTSADGTGTKYDAGQSVTDVPEGKTLHAQWTAHTFTVKFDKNKPSTAKADNPVTGEMADVTHTFDVAASLPECDFALTGYTFLGWSTDASATSATYTDAAEVTNLVADPAADGTSSVTLHAVWKQNAYQVEYLPNRPSTATNQVAGTTATSDHTYDVTRSLTTCGYTLTGWTFTGWNTASDGSGTAYADASEVENLTPADGGKVTLYAQWVERTYTLVYDSNAPDTASKPIVGSMADKTLTFDTTQALDANAFSLVGWTYTGWNTASDGHGTPYANGAPVKNLVDAPEADGNTQTTLYAQWRPNLYTVTYLPNKGAGTTAVTGSTAQSTLTYDLTAPLMGNGYSRVGYTYLGWSASATSAEPTYTDKQSVVNLVADPASDGTSNLDLYAIWQANDYQVTLDGQGTATEPASPATATVTATYDADMPAATAPAREGYDFGGFFTQTGGAGTQYYTAGAGSSRTWNIALATTLYAKWTYGVTYLPNKEPGSTDVAGVPAPTSHTYAVSSPLASARPTRVGYDFTSWNTAAAGTGTTYTPSQQVTDVAPGKQLFAQWAPKTYVATLDGQDATGHPQPSVTATYDANVPDVTTPTKTDYAFVAYRTQAAGAGDAYVDADGHGTRPWRFDAATTLYAQWDYTIAYDGNKGGGSSAIQGTTAPTHHTYKAASDLAANAFSRVGYTFRDWNTSADGRGTKYDAGQSVTDVPEGKTLHAQWVPHTFTVSFDRNKPSTAQPDNAVTGATGSVTHTFDAPTALPSCGFKLIGYTFLGWSKDPGATTPTYTDQEVVTNLVADPAANGSSSVTLYAVWRANTYQVTALANGGSLGGSEIVQATCDDKVAIAAGGANPSPATDASWTFAGWQVTKVRESDEGVVGLVTQDPETGAWLYRGGSADVHLTARWLVSHPVPVEGLTYLHDENDADIQQVIVPAGVGYLLSDPVAADPADADQASVHDDGSAYVVHAGSYTVAARLDEADFTDMRCVRWLGDVAAWDGASAGDVTVGALVDKATNSWDVQPNIDNIDYGGILHPGAKADYQAASGEPVFEFARGEQVEGAPGTYRRVEDYSPQRPTDHGVYYMRAVVAEADDWYGIASDGTVFEVVFDINKRTIPNTPTLKATVWTADVTYDGHAFEPDAYSTDALTVTFPPEVLDGYVMNPAEDEYKVYYFTETDYGQITDADFDKLAWDPDAAEGEPGHESSMVDAGTYYVYVGGINNFQGYIWGTFTILPSPEMGMAAPTSYDETFDGGRHTVTPQPVTGVLGRDTDNTQVWWTTTPDDEESWSLELPDYYDTTYQEDNQTDVPHVLYTRATNPNYVTTPTVSGSVSIRRKLVEVYAHDNQKQYGVPDPELESHAEGLVGDDQVEWDVSRHEGEELGDYEIWPAAQGVQGNYWVEVVPATFTIVRRDITGSRIEGLAASYTYAGKALTPILDVRLPDGVLLVEVRDFMVDYIGNNRPGVAVVEVTGVNNYEGKIDSSFVVLEEKARPLTVWRLYNPNSGEHFYTKADGERRALVAAGWTDEGVGWYAPDRRGDEVYRVYNPFTGDHHYTASGFERDYLVNAGWRDEGVAWLSDPERRVPLYRDYNPNARVGSHNYTTSAHEHEVLGTMGWQAEGVGWYGMPKPR